MKFSGKIGFWIDDVEVRPGVCKGVIVEKPYTGDILKNIQRWGSTETINRNLNINNRISILADMYLQNHISSIKYVEYMGTKWRVNSLEINYPRVNIEMGEVYNGLDDE